MYFVGTSGWSYYNWKNIFYPINLKPSEWLTHYARTFTSVELNNSFYNIPSENMLNKWYNNTPNHFKFSIKCWNIITHKKKLFNCLDEIKLFLNRIELLRDKCGVILLQFPASFKKDLNLLQEFLNILPRDKYFTFEFRSTDWQCEDVYRILKAHNIAFCIYDMEKFASKRIITADFAYIRLHGNEGRYQGYYSDKFLKELANWIKDHAQKAYIYFNNTMLKDDAILNAIKLKELLRN